MARRFPPLRPRPARPPRRLVLLLSALALPALLLAGALAGVPVPVPPDQRGNHLFERAGTHDASNIRTEFWNYGMVGNFPSDPIGVDLSVFHSVEVPKGTGLNYSDGITPFVLARIQQYEGSTAYVMETGFRERQGISPYHNRQMRFEPRPGYFEENESRNPSRSPAVSNDPNTWPASWPDRLDDPDDPGWRGSWNGYFGKQVVADQESYAVLDDQYYDSFFFYPDSRDSTRLGLGLRIEVRGFQWSNPQARNVIFWHYDITNEGTTDYDDNIIFGLYMDSGVGGSGQGCDPLPESDDDNAYFDRSFNEQIINLVYTWDRSAHGVSLTSDCARTGYLGYAYLETPGNALDLLDNDEDGIRNERRDGGPGERIEGQPAIEAWASSVYDLARFTATYGALADRPAYREGVWWTGDEDMDWTADLHDVGADGVAGTGDTGERDGVPTAGEPSFDRTDLNESDQIGLTGFRYNRIRAGQGSSEREVDDMQFFESSFANPGPALLYQQFSDPDPRVRFAPYGLEHLDQQDQLAANYNIGFVFASGPFTLKAGQTERFSLALAYGADLDELRRTVQTVQQIYNANYRFAVPPTRPTMTAEAGDGFVRLSWDNVAELGADPVTGEYDFEGYRIYRSTDPEFRDPQVISTGTGSGPIGNGRPIAQFDLENGRRGFTDRTVEGVAYYLGTDSGLTHTWTDNSVTNGQLYYYSVTAYDRGSDALGFFPSENAIAVSRPKRGGILLPTNVVAVRPNPRVAGLTPATIQGMQQTAGRGRGTVEVAVINSREVPEEHLFKIDFSAPSPDSVRASSYSLIDSTAGVVVFEQGRDLTGRANGTTGRGLLPVISTPTIVTVDTLSGWAPGSQTDLVLQPVTYQPSVDRNLRRPGYPDDITVVFHDEVVDTSVTFGSQYRVALPARFEVIAHTLEGDRRLDFLFRDQDGDGTLDNPGDGTSANPGDQIEIATYTNVFPGAPLPTWRLRPVLGPAPTRPPAAGDVYEIRLVRPFMEEDDFTFTTTAERVSPAAAQAQFEPYVVPNPYIGSASFEPERFAVSGRGERRLEFRGLPAQATIRIFNVVGEPVQTLRHDGSSDGFVAWDLRTKDNLEVAPGLYIFHVEAPGLGSRTGKFAIVK